MASSLTIFPSPTKLRFVSCTKVDPTGFEPATFGLQSQRSTPELQAPRGFGTLLQRR